MMLKTFPKETWNKLHLQIIFYEENILQPEEIRKRLPHENFLRNNQIFQVPSLRGVKIFDFDGGVKNYL